MMHIFIGGFFGTLARFLLTIFINRRWPFVFPFATFVINCLGSLFIGILAALHLNHTFQSLLMIGLLGGFTTFSTFSMENLQLFLMKKPFVSILYIVTTVVSSLSLCAFGFWLTN